MSIQAHPASVVTVEGVELSPDFAQMVAHASPSLAILVADGKARTRTGTAFCVDERGFFLTAHHVVDDGAAHSIIVGTDILPTMLVAVDESLDLALCVVQKLDRKFTPLRLSAAAPEPNEVIVGLGFPVGRLSISPSAYLANYGGQFIDGLHPAVPDFVCRSLPDAAMFTVESGELLGFSGGPMVNRDGRVVAVSEKCARGQFLAATTAADALKFLAANLR